MGEIKKNVVEIPSGIWWTVVAGIVGLTVTSFIRTEVQLARFDNEIKNMKLHVDKDYSNLKKQVETDMKGIEGIQSQLKENTAILIDIQKQLVLKKDKKFIE